MHIQNNLQLLFTSGSLSTHCITESVVVERLMKVLVVRFYIVSASMICQSCYAVGIIKLSFATCYFFAFERLILAPVVTLTHAYAWLTGSSRPSLFKHKFTIEWVSSGYPSVRTCSFVLSLPLDCTSFADFGDRFAYAITVGNQFGDT